jgi:sporulation protein YqfC
LTKKEVPQLRAKNWMERLTDSADLAAEPLPGQPLVELAGDRRVLIEHHRGVSQYSREQICVKVKYGHVRIDGCGLELSRMSKEQLIIAGRIDGITLIRR